MGWSLLSYTLGRWSNFGAIEGVIACMSPAFLTFLARRPTNSVLLASGLYALTFGLLGLIPAPNVRRR